MKEARQKHFDYIIVGAGPAGLQMGYFLERSNRSYVILEASDVAGAFFRHYPRHRTLLSINKRFNYFPEAEFNLRHDWNSLISDDESLLFGKYSEELYPSADDLLRYLQDYARKLELKIRFNTRVDAVSRQNGGFALRSQSGEQFSCSRLLLAIGAVEPNVPNEIEGIEHACGYHDCSIDPADYRNKRVAVIGAGNSAFEVANHLAGQAGLIHVLVRRPVRHAWQTHFVGDLRAINNTIIDMYQLKSLHATVGFIVQKIIRNPDGTLKLVISEDLPHWKVPGSTVTAITYDEVIYCTGWVYSQPQIFDPDCRPEMDENQKYPRLSPCWESSVPGLYFMGAAMAACDRKSASGFIHGFRYNVRSLHNMLEERYHGAALASRSFRMEDAQDLEDLAHHLIKRLSTVSALYQLNGFMCDALILSKGRAKICYELPVDFVHQREDLMMQENLCIVTLEYGFHKYPAYAPAIDFIHPADQHDTSCSAFLHPVIRCYSRGEVVRELHLGESLLVRFDLYDYDENIQGVHKNMLKNLFNSRLRITDETYAEAKYESDVFTPWSEKQIRDRQGHQILPESDTPCKFAV